MASDVYFNRVAYTQRRMPSHLPPDPSTSTVGTHLQRSVGTTRSGGALTFPPLYLDPVDSQHTHGPTTNPHSAANPSAQQPSFVLGSTFYHHPELNALVSNHLIDASANAVDAVSGTGHAFLSSIFASRDGNAHDGDSDADEAAGGGGGADTAVAVPRPKITSEFVSLNEDLVPASLDMHGDMLPADQHPSYPFGNLFGPLGGVIAADSAIVGGARGNAASAAGGGGTLGGGLGDAAATLALDFGGGLDGFINLGHSSHGRRSAVSNGWNNFINRASRSKIVGSSANTEWNLDAHHSTTTSKGDNARPSHRDTILSAKKLDLSPNLLFRTNTSTVLAPPTWPFRRHGPGSTSYAALLRPSSNIFGSSPASQAVAATLGGLPASSTILKEVWSDLALEELLPTHIGETSAVRHLDQEQDDVEQAHPSRSQKRGPKRPREADSDTTFAKRLSTLEPDPLDLLGPISREIRGQASQPWGSATSTRRPPNRPAPRRRRYSNQSADSAIETEHDPDIYTHRDRLRYSFALPAANFSWVQSPEAVNPSNEEEEEEGEVHVSPDGIGWSTARRIFVNEERDRLLAQVASRGNAAQGVESYRVRGLRANRGLVPRPAWRWGDADADDPDQTLGTISASGSHQTQLNGQTQETHDQQSVGDSVEYEEEDVGQDEELQRALLLHYQRETHEQAEDEAEQEEVQAEYDLDAAYSDNDEDVNSFDDQHTA
ncbi:hypothetical protein [Sporisorium scitamineum]|uniref:Uncharacterized protein n=1 Tax=Sporisorium scitamineum TaxID=49012 RepID=A0A0F7S474_9BASI|nr:hypothetical protein [Sporisorium scitamineum]